METLRRQVAERMGYRVIEIHEMMGVPIERVPEYHLLDPDGHTVGGWFESSEACWRNTPPFDTWEGVGLVIKWLMQDPSNAQSIAYLLCAKTDEFPKAICEFLLEVSE